MKTRLYSLTIALLLSCISSAATVNFSTYTLVYDAPGTDVGDQYRFEDITTQDGANVDGLLTVTGSTVSDAGFVPVESISGNDVRMRMSHELGHATLRFDFVQDGSSTLITTPLTDVTILFDDIDSDLGRDGSDFAGVLSSDFENVLLNTDTLLRVSNNIVSGYTIAHLQSDANGTYADWGNNTSTDAIGQSPNSVAFDIPSTNSINFVVGQLGPIAGFRHIDLDITPDFRLISPTIIQVPEPTTPALLLLSLSALLSRRARR